MTNKKYILGVHAGHNASACIGQGGRLLYAVQEERVMREKNYWGYPRHAIQACLEHVGASPSDIEEVVLGCRQVLIRYHSRDDLMESYKRFETVTGRMRQRLAVPLLVATRMDVGHNELKKQLDKDGLGNRQLTFFDHHTSHAATAYYGLRERPDKPYLVLTCDGAGDRNCATVRVWENGKQTVLAETPWQHSLGAIYSWVTYALGFIPLEHEYKLMGMAPYVSESATEETCKIFESFLGLDGSGLKLKRGSLLPTDNFVPEIFTKLRGVRFDYVCAGLQRFTEKVLARWCANAVRETGVRDVVAAGGVFMNVKANKRLAELPEVNSFQAFPSCGDETLCIGGFYQAAAAKYGHAEVKPLEHYYLGDDLDEADTEAAIKATGYEYSKPDNMAEAVADLLVQGEPVARCAGRMEFGARALGNRSILADPSNQDVVRVINQMVKKRDFWMPFAPMMMAEHADEYIHNEKGNESPYMMMTFDSRDNFRDLIAAIHNADLTCRAQLLREEQNPAMYGIIDAFRKKTGRKVVLNTSFNLHGFPICRDAKDALHVLKESGLNYLIAGPFLVKKTAAA